MLPVGLLAAIGLDIGDLVGTGSFSVALQQALTVARSSGDPRGVFSRFVGRLALEGVRSPYYTPSQLYRAAKYWVDQGSLINKYQGNYAIDPRLAQPVYRPEDKRDVNKRYGYVFAVTSTDPATGKASTFYREVTVGYAMSIGEAAGALEELIALHADIYDQVRGIVGHEQPPPLSFVFQRMYRYFYGADK